MRHSSKNAIPTKPQKQPAIAQNFHIKKRGGKKTERGRGGREKKKGASEGEGEEREKREVPVVAAAVLVCLPADEPQGSHGTFEARKGAEGRHREEEEEDGEKGERDGKTRKTGRKRKARMKGKGRGHERTYGNNGSKSAREEATEVIEPGVINGKQNEEGGSEE